MIKAVFLDQLDRKLRVLPYAERQNALAYYDEYISEAESETAAIAQLGTSGEVAAQILAEYVIKTEEASPAGDVYPPRKQNKARTALYIILALFAVPIGLPLLIGVGATAFGLFISLVAVVFSLVVAGLATLVAGGLSIITSPFVFFQSVGAGLVTLGTGLAAVGVGILLIRVMLYSMNGFGWIARFVGRKITKRRHSHGPAI